LGWSGYFVVESKLWSEKRLYWEGEEEVERRLPVVRSEGMLELFYDVVAYIPAGQLVVSQGLEVQQPTKRLPLAQA
jgi:hypothetical protein